MYMPYQQLAIQQNFSVFIQENIATKFSVLNEIKIIILMAYILLSIVHLYLISLLLLFGVQKLMH